MKQLLIIVSVFLMFEGYLSAQPARVVKRPKDITFSELQFYEKLQKNNRDRKALSSLQATYGENDEPLLAYAVGKYMDITFPNDALVKSANERYEEELIQAPELPVERSEIVNLTQKISLRISRGDDIDLKSLETTLRYYFARDYTESELTTLLGKIYVHWKRDIVALGLFVYSYERNQDDLANFMLLLESLERTRNHRYAYELCLEREKSQAKNPKFFSIATRIAREQGEYEKAALYARRLTKLSPKSWQSWQTLGRAAYRLGDYTEARVSLARSITINPNNVDTIMDMALLSAQKKDARECTVWLQKLKSKVDEEALLEFMLKPEFTKVPAVLHLIVSDSP